MSKKNATISIILATTVLWVVLLSCNMPFNSKKGINPSIATVAVLPSPTPESGMTVNGNDFTLVVNEQQVNAQVADALQSQSQFVVNNPHVSLRDGVVHLTGVVEQSGINLTLNLLVEPVIDSQGQLHSNIVSAKLGILPIPQSTLDQVSQIINSNLLMLLGLDSRPVTIKNVVIVDGILTVTGSYK